MLDPKSLIPEVQKLLPGVDPAEIMDGVKQFAGAHPDASNQDALAALTAYLSQQKQGQGQSAPSRPPFEGLISSLGGK